MQISNSKLCESSKCGVYSAVNHPWWMSMLFHRRCLLWLGSAVNVTIQCDGCNLWYHIICQGMNTSIHRVMAEHASYSWHCLKCGLPNFSTAIYDDFSLSSDCCSVNNFSVLDNSLPPRTSTQIKRKLLKIQTGLKSLISTFNPL